MVFTDPFIVCKETWKIRQLLLRDRREGQDQSRQGTLRERKMANAASAISFVIVIEACFCILNFPFLDELDMERRDLWRHVPLAFVVAMALTLASGLSPIFPLRQALAAGTSTQATHAAPDVAPTHNAETGTMAGQAGTDGGAASYQVPIVVPPGRAGMQPSLSLNYNSRNGDGIAGMGWSISGLSSIHRCPQTPEQDGATRGVSYSSTDRLCLDGQRLVSVDGGYGNSGTVYRTEIDSYARVTQMSGNLASSTTLFKVEQKNGRILTYGNSANSRVQPAGAAAPLSWLVDKVQDRVGNFQSYSYTNFGNGEVLLGTVTYTGLDTSLGTVAGNRSVEFSYQTRTAAAAGAQRCRHPIDGRHRWHRHHPGRCSFRQDQ